MKANTFHNRFRAGKALHKVWWPQPPQVQERPNSQSGACVHCCVHTHTLPSPPPTFTHACTRAAWPQAQWARVTGQVMGVPVPQDGRSPRAERTAEQGLSVGRRAGTPPAWGGETERRLGNSCGQAGGAGPGRPQGRGREEGRGQQAAGLSCRHSALVRTQQAGPAQGNKLNSKRQLRRKARASIPEHPKNLCGIFFFGP